MKDIEEMSLEELKAEKEKILKSMFFTAAAYKMERVLRINERIKKLKEELEKKIEGGNNGRKKKNKLQVLKKLKKNLKKQSLIWMSL